MRDIQQIMREYAETKLSISILEQKLEPLKNQILEAIKDLPKAPRNEYGTFSRSKRIIKEFAEETKIELEALKGKQKLEYKKFEIKAKKDGKLTEREVYDLRFIAKRDNDPEPDIEPEE